MAKGKGRKKAKDKWGAKEWYKIFAPDIFGGIQVGETLAEDPSKLIGRVIEITPQDISGDFSKMHIKLYLKIADVKGFDAHTIFIGHDLTSDYVRRLTRRKHTKIDFVIDGQTKDSYQIRIKTLALTEEKLQGTQQTEIRNITDEYIKKVLPELTLADIIKETINGEFAKKVFRECKHIYPLKKIEIRKTVVSHPVPGVEA
ncbi:MAG: 30S ribosomal protein S3ae [Candidatus Thermoplasmatota archaeon]